MLKNYFQIDENSSVDGFLKELSDKKNMQYIILNTTPETFIDIRTIALKVHSPNEKLKNLKKPISICHGTNKDDYMKFLIESGDRVIKAGDEYYDFLDALQNIVEHDFEFLNEKIKLNSRKEVYALNEEDKISTARNLFISKRVNLLPVIDDNLQVIGEVRSIDLLVSSLQQVNKDGYYSENYKESVYNLPIENVKNTTPLTVDINSTYREVMDLMINKKIASVIVLEQGKLSSIISYKDIFKEVKLDLNAPKYRIEYNGTSNIYDDELDLIQDYTEKCMKKIAKLSDYDTLKLSLKSHGNSEGTHQKKIEVKIVLSHGNKILHVDKEIVSGTSDEIRNDKVKGKWNVPQMVQDALAILEKKVRQEKRKD